MYHTALRINRHLHQKGFAIAVGIGLALASQAAKAYTFNQDHESGSSWNIVSGNGSIHISSQRSLTYDQATLMVELADAAYKPTTSQAKPLILENYDIGVIKAQTGLGNESEFGYVASAINPSGKLQIYIATRGTVSADDALTDGMIALTPLEEPFSKGKSKNFLVHSGFQSAALSAQNSITENLLSLKKKYGAAYNEAEIHMTGHSLGGAMTALNALWLSQEKNIAPNGVKSVVTFGTPCIGTEATVSLLDKRVPQNIHLHQIMDPVVALKSSDGYAYFKNRLGLASQDVFENLLDSHKLDGYKKSIDSAFGKSNNNSGYLTKILELPLVNTTLVKQINKYLHDGQEWIKKPENQSYLIQQGLSFFQNATNYFVQLLKFKN